MKVTGITFNGKVGMRAVPASNIVGNLTLIGNTVPPYLSTSNPIYSTGFGDKSFLVSGLQSGWGGNLDSITWNGTTHVRTTLFQYNTLTSFNGNRAVHRDPRGFVVIGAGNYNMASGFRIRTVSATTSLQTTFISENVYSGTADANYPIIAITPDPQVTNGYIGILRPTVVGHKTLIKFVIEDNGSISNVTLHGSHPSGAPAIPLSANAVYGGDGKIYLALNTIAGGTPGGPILSINNDGSGIAVAVANYLGAAFVYGLVKDASNNIYARTPGTIITKMPWTGTTYGPMVSFANVTAGSQIVTSNNGMEVGVFLAGTGGSPGTYWVLS